jgi:hypothetical protein
MNDLSNKIRLSSLGLFHMPLLQKALSANYETELISTWSPKSPGPNPDLHRKNIFLMHCALQIYTRVGWLQFHNYTYAALVALFDEILCNILSPADTLAYVPLSGVALHSTKMFQKKGVPVLLECGSTHTDHQHEIVLR